MERVREEECAMTDEPESREAAALVNLEGALDKFLSAHELRLAKVMLFCLRSILEGTVRRQTQTRELNDQALQGVLTCRTLELLEILTLKTLAVKRGLATPDELAETERELLADAAIDEAVVAEMLSGPI